MSRLKLYSSKLFALEDFEDSDVAILPDEQQAKNMAEVQENLNMIETASDTMNTVIEDSHLTENIAEIVEDAAEAGEGVSETAVTLIQEAVESIYRRHGMPKRYYPKIPSLEAYGGNRIKTAKAIRHQLKVSIEDGFIETIKSIWEKICNFFSELWDKITGNSSSNEDKATELQKRIKKLMDDKKEIPEIYVSNLEGGIPKDQWISIVKRAGPTISKGVSALTEILDGKIKETIKILSSKESAIQNFEDSKEVALNSVEQDLNEKEDEVIIKNIKPIIQEIAKDSVGEIFKDDKVNKDLLKDVINKNVASFILDYGKKMDEVTNANKGVRFPKGTEWKDLYDLAGAVKDAAKVDIKTSDLNKRISDNKELSNAISNLEKDADDELKSIINYFRERLTFFASVIRTSVVLQKKVLERIEKVVKDAEGAKDDKK